MAYRPIIDRLAASGQVMAARASLQGGWDRGPDDRGSIGVVLHMGTVADCQAELVKEPPGGQCRPDTSGPWGDPAYRTQSPFRELHE